MHIGPSTGTCSSFNNATQPCWNECRQVSISLSADAAETIDTDIHIHTSPEGKVWSRPLLLCSKTKQQKSPARKHTNWERESQKKKKNLSLPGLVCAQIQRKQRKEIISLFVDIKKWLYTSKPQYVLDIIQCLFLENVHRLKRTYIHGMIYHTTTVPHSVWVKKKERKMVGCRPKTSESIQYEWHAWSTEGFFFREKILHKRLSVNKTWGKTHCLQNSASYVGAYCVLEDFPYKFLLCSDSICCEMGHSNKSSAKTGCTFWDNP